MALIANTQRDPKKARAFRPSDFDPFAQPQKPLKADVSVLKSVFIDPWHVPTIVPNLKENQA